MLAMPSRRRPRSSHSSGPLPVRLLTALVTALLLGVTLLAAPGASGSAVEPATEAKDKIEPELGQQLADKGEATFWIRYEQADLTAAQDVADRDGRGRAVYEALTQAAESAQQGSVSLLDSAGVDYTSYWATNAIRVEAGDSDLALRVAELPEVSALYPSFEVVQEKPVEGKDVRAVNAVEWGIANINADDVWEQFGLQGEGMVIANIDTGVQYDHPALVGQYRGNNGDGTFTHDYNWFNAAGSCATAPCDTNGHGTHTMGTMVGDDAGANQIGVAPGATWIAANGCCPSDAALIESGQWMLAPTNLAGQNPDPSKRPDIINNSWGTTSPSNDPFMEDVTLAWTASGIFGMFSNGNSGPACSTSGSPGSRTANYSAGAYDVNNAIAGFSARGAGQDGEIKPNLSAPGVNVRSSLPGNTYGSFNGTSMASPHVAGTVALLWSAAPSLIGQVEETRALLDGSAIDANSTGCGGTADDNNVFGEGRLDALALLNAAPVGDTGTLVGTVTDAGTGRPIAGAAVEITGAADRSLNAGADGTYSVTLPAGDYSVAAAAFGYVGESTDVTLLVNETSTVDFALDGAASVTMSGFVNDGSGHDWPLYAKVAVDGPAPDVWTDPISGRYTMTLPTNATYSLTVTPAVVGYEPLTQDVVVGASNVRRDFDTLVDDSTCVAPGYQFSTAGVTEAFDATTTPPGWTVVDNVGNGQVWRFDDPRKRTNRTGGGGNFAIMDSDFYGFGGRQDTALVSPVVDMSGLTAPVVGFKQDYNNLGDLADVDVSIDGGATWTTVLHQATAVRGPREDVVQLPMAAGKAAVQVRFRQYEADFDWWWQVDDVFLGNRTCDPAIEGGLVAGLVKDGNDGEGVVGAKVTSDNAPAEFATTVATPDDDALGDGFYWMFSTHTGEVAFTASANQYQSQAGVLDVDLDNTTRGNFTLGAGSISVTPSELSATMTMGPRSASRTFTVANEGSAPANVEFSERPGGFTMLGADGTRTKMSTTAAEDGAALQRLHVPTSLAASGVPDAKGSDVIRPNAAPWTDIADYPSAVMDNRVVYVDGVAYSLAGGNGSASSAKVYAYDAAALAWTERASLPAARNAVAAGVVDGQIVVVGGWAESGPSPATWAYDPGADTWTARANAPVARAAAAQAVLDGRLYMVGGCTSASCTPMANSVAAYDLASDTWETLADYPASVAFASCGAVDGLLYCTGGNGGSGGTADSYAYDPGADAWTPIADAPADTWASAYAVANGTLVVNGGVQGAAVTNRSFAYDAAAGSWTDLPNSNTARYRGGAACGLYKIGGSSGGFTATVDTETLPGFEDCGVSAADVEWLSVNKTSAALAPGESVQVRVTMDANVAQPGAYAASIAITDDVPGSVEPVGVTMTIRPPGAWGKLAGVVSGRSCAGDVAPLPAATLQVDSWAGSWSFETAADGGYAYWFNTGANPLTLIAAKDGYAPQTRKARLYRGETLTADFTLRKRGC